jgi:hypothetical protein
MKLMLLLSKTKHMTVFCIIMCIILSVVEVKNLTQALLVAHHKGDT